MVLLERDLYRCRQYTRSLTLWRWCVNLAQLEVGKVRRQRMRNLVGSVRGRYRHFFYQLLFKWSAAKGRV